MSEDSFTLELASASIDLADIAGTLVPVVGKAIAHWANRNTRALIAARDEAFRDWVVEEKRATVEHAKTLAEQASDLEALRNKLEELTSDPSVARIRDNYGYEAAREAIDERRRMLAFASAGSLNVELTVGQLARVERTVRELDPEDVRLLDALARTADPPTEPGAPADWFGHLKSADVARAVALTNAGAAGQSLMASGCVRTFNVSPHSGLATPAEGAALTHVGAWVLRVLDGYIRAMTP